MTRHQLPCQGVLITLPCCDRRAVLSTSQAWFWVPLLARTCPRSVSNLCYNEHSTTHSGEITIKTTSMQGDCACGTPALQSMPVDNS